jgi:hypothetical protein
MILIALVALKLAKNLQDLFYAKYVLKYLEKLKNVIIATSYFAKDALKIGYN